MALNIPSSFSIFSPKCPSSSCPRPPTEVRFSRWNNANAQKFIIRERAQKEIEDELRRQRRFDSATRIVENYDPSTADPNEAPSPPSAIKSVGTPSFPSRPSIPGKKSKYSKIPRDDSAYSKNPRRVISHPAFRPINWLSRVPSEDENSAIDGTPGVPPEDENSGIREHTLDKRNSSHPAFRRVRSVSSIAPENSNLGVALGEHGISYRVPNAPFEYQYSYTETPKVKPLALREPPFLPFGPSTMPRPWTGRAPIPPSKKKLPEFDSFRLPAPGKKGVKPVQAPGPFLAGSGPKYVKSREEILGEPLTEQEVKELIKGTMKSKRQLHMGRDGLTHNMLDNIHSHWKRKRVCKIKCIGVCTVDMDNVRQQLEEKTGGKIIYNRGGVIYLFRGRNYNYKTRPRYPLMLWRPITPVYPRLIQRVPEGLTLEEVTAMRKRGRELPPICKLGKNGLYSNLVMNVREAFEECELVRINCQGMDKSDFKKIGAKLKDLVPCVLISFEREHILMWRGKDWKSSLPILGNAVSTTEESITEAAGVSIPEDGFNQAVNCTTDDSDVLRIPENEFSQVAETASEGVCISLNSASDCALTGHEEVSDFGASKSPKLDAFVATSNPNTCLSLGGEGLGVNDIPHSETQNQPLAAVNGFPNISNGVTIGEEAVISPEKHIGNDDSLSVNEVGCEEPPTLAEAVSENEAGCEESPTLAEVNEVGCEEPPTLAEAVSENEVGCEEPPTLAEAISENEVGCEEAPTLAEAVSENEVGCEEPPTLAEAVSENEVGCEELPTLGEAVSENEVGCEELPTLAEAVLENEVGCEEPPTLAEAVSENEVGCEEPPTLAEAISENEVGCEESPTLAEAVSENEVGCEELPTLAEAVSENEVGCEESLTLAEAVSENEVGCEEPPTLAEAVSENEVGCEESLTLVEAVSENEVVCEEPTSLTGTWQGLGNSCPSKARCTEGVLLLRQQAVEAGLALVLDDDSFDANIVFERAVALVKTAPPGPTFRTRVRKVVRSRSEEKAENNEIPEVREAEAFSEKKKSEKSSRSRNRRRKDIEDPLQPNFVPHGSLKIDELAKLLGS